MPTIGSTLSLSAGRCPSRTALVFGDRSYTYCQLDSTVNRIAGALANQGLGKGDRMLLMSGNSDGYVIALYAALKLGAIVVPVNPRSAAPELQYLLEDSEASVLVFGPDVEQTVRRRDALPGLSLRTPPIALGHCEGHRSLFDLAEGLGDEAPEVAVDEADDALILYTSGTTGRPKGALFDHHRILWVGVNTSIILHTHDGDRILHVAPMYHSAELSMLLVHGTWICATHVVLPGFEPETVLEAMERDKINVFFGVPTMYQMLLRSPSLTQRDLSSWRVGMFGAAPMPAAAVQSLVEALPGVALVQACGQTEGGPGGIYCAPEEVRARPDASGRRALPNTEVRIVDGAGRGVGPGAVGEMIMRGETMMKAYWRNPEATAETVRDGWVHTGDLARIDTDGYITLVDRLKDLIITGGRNVYSVEVEKALAGHPGVLEVAVISKPSEEFGETIVAVATLAPGATVTLEELRAFAGERIADYK
ncbi:MAG: class I adenylate-forming enzyme family protein, partial [Candidatus Dormibacteria bacterium]